MAAPHIKAAKAMAKEAGAEFIVKTQRGHLQAAIILDGMEATFILPTSPANQHTSVLRARVYVRHALDALRKRSQADINNERRNGRIKSIKRVDNR